VDGDGGLKPYEEGLISQGFQRPAGVDEVGRGPLAGPVVAAAVILEHPGSIPGLKDSKQVSPPLREELCRTIRGKALAVSVAEVDQSVIDSVNILRASYMAMAGAVDKLAIPPDFILVDGLANPELTLPQWPIVGGDKVCASIAAASIVAKVHRDALMSRYHDLYPYYNFIRNKGYPTPEHRRAIARYGPCPLHRRTFRGVKEFLGKGGKGHG
jgi:ribonuclease HII